MRPGEEAAAGRGGVLASTSSSPAGQLVVIGGVMRRPLGGFPFVTAAFAPNKPISPGLALSDNLRYFCIQKEFKTLEILLYTS